MFICLHVGVVWGKVKFNQCITKAAITKYERLGDLNNRNYFPKVSEVQISVSVELVSF